MIDGMEKLNSSAPYWHFVSFKLLCHHKAVLRAQLLGKCLNRAESSGCLWTFHLYTCPRKASLSGQLTPSVRAGDVPTRRPQKGSVGTGWQSDQIVLVLCFALFVTKARMGLKHFSRDHMNLSIIRKLFCLFIYIF